MATKSVISQAKNLAEMSDEDWLADDPLRDFHVWWMRATEKDTDRLEACLKKAKREEDVQQFLQKSRCC